MSDVTVQLDDDHVATVQMHRPPHNFFDVALVSAIADAYEELQQGPCRAIVLCSEGRHFCAGADLTAGTERTVGELYEHAVRLFQGELPVVAAVQGAAIGGGLGLALSADFRVASSASRFSANFAQLGFHHGFGLTVTLPKVVGYQAATWLLYSGERLDGEAARALGLCDRLVAPAQDIYAEARAMAAELAAAAPLSVRSIRATMRAGLAEAVREATMREHEQQNRLLESEDFAEGVSASSERRRPQFNGR